MRNEFIDTIMELTRCPGIQSQDASSCCNTCRLRFFGTGYCREQLEAEATRRLNAAICSLTETKTQPKTGSSLEWRIADILRNIGVSANLRGYKYLKYAIQLAIENPNVLNGITKNLYPDVAKHFQSDSSKVERGMRHAIDVAWLRGDVDIQQVIFGNSVNLKTGKPTNSEFIAGVAEYLGLEGKV